MVPKLRTLIAKVPASDVFWLAGAGLVAAGAGLERLSAGLIVGGAFLLAIGVGSVKRAR
jgi:hypothetical protein